MPLQMKALCVTMVALLPLQPLMSLPEFFQSLLLVCNKSLFESCWQAISDGANGEVETPEKSSPKRKLEIAPGRRARRQLEQADCAPGRRARRKLEQESPEEDAR